MALIISLKCHKQFIMQSSYFLMEKIKLTKLDDELEARFSDELKVVREFEFKKLAQKN